MKHHAYIGLPTFILFSLSFLLFPLEQVWAVSKLSQWTTPFGGKVISLEIPTVECPGAAGQGTAPVLLSSNLAGLGQATIGATGKQSALSRAGNIGTGLYKAIPLYTLRISSINGESLKQPKVGDWILGRQYLVPDVSTCQTDAFGAPIPFPVVKTDNYGTSR